MMFQFGNKLRQDGLESKDINFKVTRAKGYLNQKESYQNSG